MTGPLQRFPDVQAALVTLLESLAGAGRTGIETPGNLQDVLPFVRVIRRGGTSDRINDHATVEVDVFDLTYKGAELLAERVREYLTGERLRAGPAVIDRVTCERAPAEVPWGPGVRRFNAAYRLVSRRYTAAG